MSQTTQHHHEHVTAHKTLVVPSPIGPLSVTATPAGICAVRWPQSAGQAAGVVADTAAGEDATVCDNHLRQAQTELGEYFTGERTRFAVAVAASGTPFQQSAWAALQTIDYGTTISYGEQAGRLGDRNKARAAGAANAKNPVAILVPCHRVIGTSGALTGFAGGLDAKVWLLAHEQGRTVRN